MHQRVDVFDDISAAGRYQGIRIHYRGEPVSCMSATAFDSLGSLTSVLLVQLVQRSSCFLAPCQVQGTAVPIYQIMQLKRAASIDTESPGRRKRNH